MEEDVHIQLLQAVENSDIDGVLDCVEEGVNLDQPDSVKRS